MWQEIQASGVCPKIRSLRDYETKVSLGIASALLHLEGHPLENPEAGNMLLAHKFVFEGVHPWAGQFRASGEEVAFSGMIGCPSDTIDFEIELLRKQTDILLSEATSKVDRLAVVAFHHSKLERLHPFADGNGRAGRVIADCQTKALFGDAVRLGGWGKRTDYVMALMAAQRAEDLAPMMRYIAGRSVDLKPLAAGLGSHPSPFKMGPGYYEDEEVRAGVDEIIGQTRHRQASPSLPLPASGVVHAGGVGEKIEK